MPPTPRFLGSVENGKLKLDDLDKLAKYLQGIKGKVSLVVKRYREKSERSNNQNRYYWGVVIDLIADHTGYTPEEAHDAMKMMFLRKYEDSIIPTIRSTTDLNTIEFEEYMKSVRQWASMEIEVYIPLPNETEFNY